MKLYFGNTVTTVTTLMIIALVVFTGYTFYARAGISHWDRRSALLLVYGLAVCCFATARDGLDRTIQNAIDGSCAPGIFQLISVPTVIGCIGALIIIVAAIATLFTKSQHMREIWFFLMSGGALLKILTMEIAMILM